MAKFKKATADEARAKRKDHVASRGNSEIVVKGFRSPKSWNESDRSAVFTMTSETEDRYGDIVVQSGLNTDRFMENPVGLLFHNSRTWPCGNWSNVTKLLNGRPKRTEGTLAFLPEGTDEDADRAARHVAAGVLRTVSIGFAPDWEQVEFILDDDGDWTGGFRFNTSELLECSLVPIPAQPDALVKDAGGDLKLARDLIEDVLDNYVRSPEGLLLPMDEYRAKHLDLVGNQSYHIVRTPAAVAKPEVASADDLALQAQTNDEARAYAGAKVRWNPTNADNQKDDSPAKLFFTDMVGEIIAGWIVPSGEFKGVFALAVEWTDETGVARGMTRGIKAEQVLLVKAAADDEPDPAEDPDEDPDEPEVDADKGVDEDAGKDTEQAETGEAEEESAESAENKTGTIVVPLSVDTSEAEAAVERVEGLFTRLAKKFPLFFKKQDDEDERIEPVVHEPAPPAPPSTEAIAAARAKAAAMRERLANKGLIAS